VIGLSPELETILRARLAKDSVVNPKLIADFYQEYKALLPVGASPETTEWRRNETLAIVDLTFDFSTPPSQPSSRLRQTREVVRSKHGGM